MFIIIIITIIIIIIIVLEGIVADTVYVTMLPPRLDKHKTNLILIIKVT